MKSRPEFSVDQRIIWLLLSFVLITGLYFLATRTIVARLYLPACPVGRFANATSPRNEDRDVLGPGQLRRVQIGHFSFAEHVLLAFGDGYVAYKQTDLNVVTLHCVY
jgi:hypothetical protein